MAANGGAGTEPARDDEHVELMRNFGDHQLMQRVQDALKTQLANQLLQAEEELRLQEEAREKARRAREDTGVSLYGVQQQLARIQLDIDGKSKSIGGLQGMRASKEEELRRFQDSYAARKAQVEEQEAKLEKFKGELDGVLDTVRQVEKYNEEIAAEIALTRRATYKAEEDMQERERAKTKQDAYIDHLNLQLKKTADDIALVEAQIASQKSETSRANDTMADAAKEMETIEFEKKQLLLQWQSSLVALRRRDEALTAARKAIQEAQDKLNAMDAEQGNLRKTLHATADARAKLQDQADKEENDLRYLENQLAQLQKQFEALDEREEQLKGTLDGTDTEVKRATVEQTKLLRDVRELEHQRFVADKQRYELEAEINSSLGAKTTNEKAAKAMLKEVTKLMERSQVLEISEVETENSIATAKVQALNVAAHINGLRDQLAAMEADLAEKERMSERYEVEIRQRSDAIEKKMAVVDRLNRKWERIIESMPEAENMGPLQAEIHNLQKQIAVTREASDALQRRWLADQTALVNATRDTEVKTTNLREMTSQAVLLNQKRIRLDAAIEAQRTELRRLEAGLKTMHDDMARINALISKNDKLSKKLAAANYANERAFGEELKELERETASLDARVASLDDEKVRLLEELLECERQVVLWEKKITLEKEMQETLDPTVGESEVAAMEKEIHRMRMRYDSLKREQERLITEMERAIEKREVIAMKHKSAKQMTLAAASSVGKGMMASTGASTKGLSTTAGKGSDGDALTRIGLQRRAAALRQEIATKLVQTEELEAAISGQLAEADIARSAMDTAESDMEAWESRVAQMQRAISSGLYEKQKAVEQVAALARLLQRFEALESGRLPALTSDEAAHVTERLAEAEQARSAVLDIIAQLTAQHAELTEVLDRVRQLSDIVPR